jgi:elongation factor P--beta-lysine ligase
MYEPHLLQQQAYNSLLERVAKLSPESQAQWGEMNTAQMLAHVAAFLKLGMSDKKARQTLMGRIFGRSVKRQILTKGVPQNLPTIPRIKIADAREFQREKEGLKGRLEQFFDGGELVITKQPHDFFGHLTPNEWARLQYLHLDHHFKQFGV